MPCFSNSHSVENLLCIGHSVFEVMKGKKVLVIWTISSSVSPVGLLIS